MMVVATRKRKVSRSEPWDFFDISEMSRPRKHRKYRVDRDMHKQGNSTKSVGSENVDSGRSSKVCYLWKKKKRMKLKNPLIVMKRDTTIVTVVNLIWILQLRDNKGR